MTTERQVQALAARLRGARRVTVLTGAGVSAASGVPTFRGPNGLWRQYRVEELATPQAFAREPRLVWDWYAWRREQIAVCRPNRAHEVLAAWSMRHAAWRVITQNVDDLHLRAGTRELIQLHGSIWELSCWAPCDGTPRQWRDERVPFPEALPRCRHCTALARPAVVWFGEPLNARDLRAAHAAVACDVFIAAGTSALVYPAAGLIDAARARGAYTVEINPESTSASAAVDLAIQGAAEEVLPEVEALL